MRTVKNKLSQSLLSILILIVTILSVSLTVKASEYVLPEDLAVPVITMDYQGDRLRRINKSPTVSIFSDGQVILPRSYAHTRAYQGSISQTELQQLLSFIIKENQFFNYDENLVKSKLSNLKNSPLPVHFTTTVISVNTNDQQKLVRLKGLGKGTMIEETRQMLAIKHRLDHLISIVKLGGVEKVQQLLFMANNERNLNINRQNSNTNFSMSEMRAMSAGAFTVADLQIGGFRADGSMHVRFKRENGVLATINMDSKGESSVALAIDE